MDIKKQIRNVGLCIAYVLIGLITIFGSIAEEIPSVQLEDTNPITYLNIFDYNTSVHNNLTGKQGGLAPNQYYHLSLANYLLIETILGNITFDLSDFDLQEGYIYYGNSSNNPEGKSSSDFISEFNFGNWTGDKPYYWNTSTKLNVLVNITTSGWFNGKFNISTADDWNSFDGSLIDFNESKLETSYYNATSILVIKGTPSGSLTNIQTYNNVPYNISEVASDLELRVNFTGVISFNNLIVRYKSGEEDEPHIIYVQIWDYEEEIWEDYDRLVAVGSYIIRNLGVYDSDEHIEDGVVQVRFYQDEGLPAKTHLHNFDWVALSKGYGVPSGQDIDTTYTSGDGLSLIGTVFSHNDSSSQVDEDNSGRTYIQDIILDTYGHIINLSTAIETVTDTDTYNTTDEMFNAINNSDSIQFNNVTINNIIFDENKTISINDTCMIFKVFDTYINLCK